MAVVDILMLGVVLLSCLFGAFRGLVKEALSLVFWIGAVLLATTFDTMLGTRLTFVSQSLKVQEIAAFVLIFVFTVFGGALVSNLISKLMNKAGLGGTDRALGALFGIVRGVVILTVVVVMGRALSGVVPWIDELFGGSILVPYIMVLADFFLGLFGIAPPMPVTDATLREQLALQYRSFSAFLG